MKKIQYADILKRAFLMVWENKFLWVFGLFIFLGSLSANFGNSASENENDKAWETISNYIQENPKLFIGIVLAAIVLVIILLVLRIIATAALIKSANNIVVYSQSKILAIFSEAKRYFWRLLLLEIIICVVFLVVLVILAIPVVYLWILKATISAIISTIIAVVIFLVLVIIAQYLRKYAYFYVVLGEMKIKMALESAYLLFRKNVWESLIMGLFGIIVCMAAMMAAGVAILALAILFAPFGFLAYFVFAKTGTLVVLVIGIIVACIIALVLMSFVTAFSQVIWVLFFQEISLEKKEEKKSFEEVGTTEKIPDPEIV